MVGEVVADDVEIAAVTVGDALADDALVDGGDRAAPTDADVNTVNDLRANQESAIAIAIDADVVAHTFDVDGDLFSVGGDAGGVIVGVHPHRVHVGVSSERGGSGEHEVAGALELGGAGGFVSMARAGDGGEFEGGGIGSFTDETEIAGVGDDGVVVLVVSFLLLVVVEFFALAP